MNAVVKVNPNLPAIFAKALAEAGGDVSNELSAGVTSGFPVISIRGKVWRVRKGGTEENIVNGENEAVPSLEVVLIKSNPNPSKIYYANAYEEGNADMPDCWSADGIRPDAGVQKPQCKTCVACPNNVWGSKITSSGSKTKKCSDARRMAVVSKDELEEKGAEATLYLLRVPPASLNPLKDYAEKVLKPKAIPYFAVVTKIGFDPQSSYPKMTFKPKRFLSEDEAVAIIKLRDSEDVRRILAESEEYTAPGTPTGDSEGSAPAEEGSAPAPGAASQKPKKAKPRPAEEEDVGLGDEEETPAPAPVKAKKAPVPAAVVEDDDEEEIAPPPPKKKAPAPAPVVAEDDDEEEAVAPPPKAKKAPVPAAAVVDEDDEEEIAPPPVKAKKKPAAPAPVVEEEEEVAPPPKKKKAAAAPPADDAADGGDFDSMLKTILGPSS